MQIIPLLKSLGQVYLHKHGHTIFVVLTIAHYLTARLGTLLSWWGETSGLFKNGYFGFPISCFGSTLNTKSAWPARFNICNAASILTMLICWTLALVSRTAFSFSLIQCCIITLSVLLHALSLYNLYNFHCKLLSILPGNVSFIFPWLASLDQNQCDFSLFSHLGVAGPEFLIWLKLPLTNIIMPSTLIRGYHHHDYYHLIK